MKNTKDVSGWYSIVYKKGENVVCGACGDVAKCPHQPLIDTGDDFIKAFGGRLLAPIEVEVVIDF